MIIQYFGKCFVKVSVGDETIALGPISKSGDIKAPSFGADLAVVPASGPNYNGSENMTYGNKQPFVIDGPGEYEVNGTFVQGWSVGDAEAATNGKGDITTLYKIIFDDINICYAGPLSSTELPIELLEGLGDVDILFLPTYNDETLDTAVAHKFGSRLSPKIIIPMFYGGPKSDSLKAFFKESGEDFVKPVEKLTLKRKDLDGKEGEIIPIQSYS